MHLQKGLSFIGYDNFTLAIKNKVIVTKDILSLIR